MTQTIGSVDKKVCRKKQGKAEEGNTCLETPGTCESCPDHGKAGEATVEIFLTDKERLDIYNYLREAHKHVRAIYQKYTLAGTDENAIDAVDSVMYLAEGVFAEQK